MSDKLRAIGPAGSRSVSSFGMATLCGAVLALGPATCFADSLFDAIQLAYQNNPSLRAQRAELRAVDEGYIQAQAGYGPQASVSGQVGYQSARVQVPASIFTPAGTTAYGATTGSVDLSVVQPLYTAGAVAAEVRSATANIFASRETLRQAESQLILNVVTAYLDVRRDRKSLDILRNEITVLTDEFNEISAKGKLGAVSKTDVAQAEARLLSAQAAVNQARGHLDASDAEYLSTVGENPGELEPEPDLPGLPDTVDTAFESAEHNNAQLLNATELERVARDQVDQAKAANGPTLSLRFDAAIAPTEPYLVGQYDRSLTAALVFTQPLFTSGLNRSKIRQALEKDNEAQLNIEVARRGIIQSVTQAWAQLTSTRNAITVEQRQVGVERDAAVGNRVEERAGLRSTIDLLNAETELTDSQLNLLQSQHDEYIARAALLAAMGVLEVRLLTPGVQIYHPESSFNRSRGSGAAPWEGTVGTVDSLIAAHTPQPRPSAPRAGSGRPVDLQPLPPVAP